MKISGTARDKLLLDFCEEKPKKFDSCTRIVDSSKVLKDSENHFSLIPMTV